jgi:hypothetical protein
MSTSGPETGQGHQRAGAQLEWEPHYAYCRRLAEEASARKAALESLGEKSLRSSLAAAADRISRLEDATHQEKLARDAKLQWDAAIETGYVPSKWLLEQEMKARRRWDPHQHEFLDEPVFKDSDEGNRDVFEVASEEELTGLCFSGGGIRSATFNLGVLQGLAQLGLLPCFDYLSSVSGGGYIHEFLAAWILRDREGRKGVERGLIPQAEPGCPPRSPEPIKWLQRYASYLTPRRGMISTDTWTMIAIWFRNTVLNQIPIVSFFAASFFLINLLVQQPLSGRVSFRNSLERAGVTGTLWSGGILLVLVLWSLVALARDLRKQENIAHSRGRSNPSEDSGHRPILAKKRWLRRAMRAVGEFFWGGLLSNVRVRWLIIVPWLGMAVWASYWPNLKIDGSPWWHPFAAWIGCALVFAAALIVAFAGGSLQAFKGLHPEQGAWGHWLAGVGMFLAAAATTVVACLMGYGFILGGQHLAAWISASVGNLPGAAPAAGGGLQLQINNSNVSLSIASAGSTENLVNAVRIDPWRIQIVLLPALLLSVPYVAVELTLGLLGRVYADARREWLARVRAWSLLYALMWVGVTAIALLAPYLTYFIISKGSWAVIPAAATFVISHVTTILAGSSSKSDGKPSSKGILGYKPTDLLALGAASIAILTFLITLSSGVIWLAGFLVQSPFLEGARSWFAAHPVLHLALSSHGAWRGGPPRFAWKFVLLASAAIFAAVASLFGWRVDINDFSMQSFYRNRLSRCYLGATTWDRKPNPFTGFDSRSHVQVVNERGRQAPVPVINLLPDNFDRLGKPKGEYGGPFPIFCSTLNLTTGEDLASQERKGTSFTFTPLYSGYTVSWTDGEYGEKVSVNGYVPTQEYAYKHDGIHLDTAVAVSGAAVNPNQGYNSIPVLAFLMAFFNVRLGWWITNPRKFDIWRAQKSRPTPLFPLKYLLKELFGSANDKSNFVNLSDGGHFENMGLYELVRRRCKYIVVCDAEEDPEMQFCGIGNAVNQCRADFGAAIDLDLRPLQLQDDGFSKTHCVVGTIDYPPPKQDLDPGATDATVCECLGEKDDDRYQGIILYIKSSVVGDEPADLMAYKLQHDQFPQDSTANQWFTETQFESYRMLGHHIATTAIQPALQPHQDRVRDRGDIPELFKSMYAIWYPRTPEMDKYLTQHVEKYEDILKELRERAELAGLAARLNDDCETAEEPVIWTPPEKPEGSADYALQFANSVLDFMYTVYADLDLAFPANRTSPHAAWWICLFRRWCRVSFMRHAWKKLTPIYSREFQQFAGRELKLP